MAAFLENILIGNQYVGIEFFSVNNEEKTAFLQVWKNKGELAIFRQEIFTGMESLKENKIKLPAVIIINNEQVLQKEVQGTDTNDRKLLNKAFPNMQADDFYFEIWRREHTSIVAVCRKSYTDGVLSSLKDVLRVTHISLGVTALSFIADFELPAVITTNTQEIGLANQENGIRAGRITPQTYGINGLEVPNTHLLSFCGVLKYVLPGSTTGNVTGLGTTLKENFKQKAFFEKGLTIGIGTLLALLLINFFFFTYYFDKATAIDETVSLNRSGIENIVNIKLRIKEKERKLESFANNAASGSSVIINDIVKNIPHSMLLNELSYHPLEKKLKEGETVATQDSLIIVSGTTLSNTAFTSWVGNLEKLAPADKVTITSFGKDEAGKTEFSVKITLKQ